MEDEKRDAHMAGYAIGAEPLPGGATDAASAPRSRIGIWRWLGWTFGASALGGVIAAALVFYQAPPPPSMGGIASLRGAPGTGVFAFQIGKQQENIVVFANVAPPPAGKAYELWVLVAGGKPLPLGIFKPGVRDERPLPTEIAQILSNGAPMNVTLEPADGGLSGVPTGPVVFHGYFTLLKEPIDQRK
jgi:anti-sigma-K factor RskA